MLIKKSFFAIFLLFTMCYSANSIANCPAVDQVTYVCSSIGGKQHCNWTAPWWEGYQGHAAPGDHPVRFQVVFWGASSSPEMGSTNCFYRDKSGEWVELSQNNWGGVAKPLSSRWRDGDWPAPNLVLRGRVCTDNTAACSFAYGARQQ